MYALLAHDLSTYLEADSCSLLVLDHPHLMSIAYRSIFSWLLSRCCVSIYICTEYEGRFAIAFGPRMDITVKFPGDEGVSRYA